MKKLLTICLIMATVFTVNAQDGKPTKEETVAYLTRSFKLVEGEKIYMGKYRDITLSNYDFQESYIKTTFDDGSSVTDSDFKWETLYNITSIDCPTSDKYKVCEMNGIFNSSFKSDIGTTNYFTIYVLKSRAESVKKAFLRLSAIAKEENKDPFKD
ncbi:hypothetical protein FBBAL38_11734 [Flavobacteria bacterium BAL38]|nr:hypothetical protein FBBAL38_11734 [Flavobacteria bacterium BAL38]